MDKFINNLAKIKMSKIAKENNLDYGNIIRGKAKKEDIEYFNKLIKRKILTMFLYDLITEEEKDCLFMLEKTINFYYENGINEFDIVDICNIRKLLDIIKGE